MVNKGTKQFQCRGKGTSKRLENQELCAGDSRSCPSMNGGLIFVSSCQNQIGIPVFFLYSFSVKPSGRFSILSVVAGAMLALYFLSFFLCSDEQCLSGNCDGDCEALICLWAHGSSCAVNVSVGSSHDDCRCVCHVPTTPVPVCPTVTLIDVGRCIPVGSSDYPSLESSSVFHPPLSA